MGGKKILFIYEDKQIAPGAFTADDVVSALEKLQKKDKYEIKDYSFADFAEKDDGDVKFWKAVIVCKDASDLLQKVMTVTKKFDPEDGADYRVVIVGQPNLAADSPINENHVISTPEMKDVLTWWPKMLQFLFPRKNKEDGCPLCLLLFDHDAPDELRWYVRTSVVLQSLGISCQWLCDVQVPIKPDFVIAMSRFGGVPMVHKTSHLLKQKIKTIVLTDDAHSTIVRSMKKQIDKVYVYPTENPLELSFIGWSMLLREVKLIECEDIVFKEKRNMKKIMVVLIVLFLLFVVLPLTLAVVAAFVFLCVCGVDVDKVCNLGCCMCGSCGPCCMECLMEIPICLVCCVMFREEEDVIILTPEDV